MKIELELMFQSNSLNGSDYINIFNQFVKFSPRSFTLKHTMKEWDDKKHLKMIANANYLDTLIVGGDDFNIFLATNIISKNPYKIIQIVQDKELFFPKDEEIERLIERDDFISAYLYDAEYVDIQSAVSESSLINKNLPLHLLETIKNTPTRHAIHSREFDVRFNPGRRIMIAGARIVAAWKMWFGQPFFDIVAKKKLLTFPFASEARELNSGKVFIKLFDEVEKSHTRENMFIQWKWQEWIDYDTIIAKYQ